MKKKNILIMIFIFMIALFLLLLINSSNKNKDSNPCNKYSIYGEITYDKNNNYSIKNITYCTGFDISKYKKINATLFKKENNSITEVTTYDYDEKSSILLDKFFIGKEFKEDYSKYICMNFKKENLYLEVKVVTFDEKIDIINIPLFLKGKCK